MIMYVETTVSITYNDFELKRLIKVLQKHQQQYSETDSRQSNTNEEAGENPALSRNCEPSFTWEARNSTGCGSARERHALQQLTVVHF